MRIRKIVLMMMTNPPHTEKILRSSVGIMEVCKIYYSNHFALCMYQPIYQEFYFIVLYYKQGKGISVKVVYK